MAMTLPAIVAHVKKHMTGRMCDEENNVLQMLEACQIDGDHLEIGTLHGGSAVAVALMKMEYGLSGKVVCVDPLSGYYMGLKRGKPIDPYSGTPVSRAVLEKNARTFRVELEIMQMKSDEAFDEFRHTRRRFASAYIDGDHWGDAPLRDLYECMNIVSTVIAVDNYDRRHIEVMQACDTAAKYWEAQPHTGILYVLRKP